MFKDIFKTLREKNNLTQKELAKYLGISDRSVGYYENGQRMPPPDMLEKIADYFNVSVDYLLGRTDKITPYLKKEYPKSNDLIDYITREAEKYGYNLKNKSKEELAEIIVKALKIDEINKGN